MVMKITGGGAATAALEAIARKLGDGHGLRVGFFEDAEYPDGTKVATAAAINNFGAPAAGIPARPFFTNMIDQQSPKWGPMLTRLLAMQDNDFEKALSLMGEDMAGELQESIKQMNSPALSEVTLMLRKMKSEDQTLVVTGATVGEAARRVASGEAIGSVNRKPLNETAHMQNSIGWSVDAEAVKHLPPVSAP